MSNRTRNHAARRKSGQEELDTLEGLYGNRKQRRAAVRAAGVNRSDPFAPPRAFSERWKAAKPFLLVARPIFLGIRQFKRGGGRAMANIYKENAWASLFALRAREQEKRKGRGKLKDYISHEA